MAKHEDYDKWYEAATVVTGAEGVARVGLSTCKVCGLTVTLDERDPINRLRQHAAWHEALEATLAMLAEEQK